MAGWTLDNARVNYTVTMNGRQFTSSQSFGASATYETVLAAMQVPGLTVANGTEITVSIELVWTDHNDGTTVTSVTGTGYIY